MSWTPPSRRDINALDRNIAILMQWLIRQVGIALAVAAAAIAAVGLVLLLLGWPLLIAAPFGIGAAGASLLLARSPFLGES